MDLYSRKIISWAFSDRANSKLVRRALQLAIEKRRPKESLVFHSDQGCQYSSEAFLSCLQYHSITASMSRKGNCLDNAVVERFFRSLKSERINYRRYLNRHQAVADIIDYIEPFYNQVRRHAHLGNISPDQYEARTLKAA
ncbi:IS3 family transposase [Pseudomonas sp. F1_0610]